jgi:hypothetical protein
MLDIRITDRIDVFLESKKSVSDAFHVWRSGVSRHIATQKHFHGELLIKSNRSSKRDTNEAYWRGVLPFLGRRMASTLLIRIQRRSHATLEIAALLRKYCAIVCSILG